MERCYGYEGGVRKCGKVGQLSGSVTVLRCFVSWWGDVMVMGRSKRAWGGASLGRKGNSHQGGVKCIKNEC